MNIIFFLKVKKSLDTLDSRDSKGYPFRLLSQAITAI